MSESNSPDQSPVLISDSDRAADSQTGETARTSVRSSSRRQFVKLIPLGVGAIALAAKGISMLQAHPELPEKAYRSITSGKAVDDFIEIFQSRLHLKNNPLTMTELETESEMIEPWMREVAESVQVLQVVSRDKTYPLLLFDITGTTGVVAAVKKETQLPENDLTTRYYDLGQALAGEKALTLPMPQYRVPVPEVGVALRYYDYLMFAQAENQSETGVQKDISRQRGGLVLDQTGRLLSASPDEFTRILSERPLSVQAAIEYPFTLDSANLEASYEAIASASGTLLKDLLYSSSGTNAVLTIYREDGSFRTYLWAEFQPVSQIKSLDDPDHLLQMNPLQLASLAGQLMDKLNGNRFVISLTDPSPEAANCYSPWQLSREELVQRGYEIGESSYQNWMQELGVEERYFRTVGSAANFAFPGLSFPWVLATKKTD